MNSDLTEIERVNVNWNIITLLVFMNLSPKSVSIIVVVSSDKSWWPSAQDFLQYGRDHLVCDIAAKYLKQVKASKFCYRKTRLYLKRTN